MNPSSSDTLEFLDTVNPYNTLEPQLLEQLAAQVQTRRLEAGDIIYRIDEPLGGLFIIRSGEVEISDRNNITVSLLTTGNTFGERGLLHDGNAATNAKALQNSTLLIVPTGLFRHLIKASPTFARFFTIAPKNEVRDADFATQKVSELISGKRFTCEPDTSVADAARKMREAHVSSLVVTRAGTDQLLGLITLRDLANRVLAEGLDATTPVSRVMTATPVTLPSSALGIDVLSTMLEKRVGHMPIVDQGQFKGMITQTDITRFQAMSSALLVRDIRDAERVADMTAVTERIPQLLVRLVASHSSHEVITRSITDLADAITRRLLKMAEARLGPPPVPYLWLACGSQGRQEQTGLSDQDNCLFLDDRVSPDDMPYFSELARFVSDGLNACGYVYCPGDMMATNPRWCQPVRVWRDYFHAWAVTHKPESQMLASVMFDLRPIGGDTSLYQNLQAETLAAASRNSIFVAHMIANSLKHTPPLGLIRGFSTIRSGERRHQIDMKHNGVIPVTDLARVYALQGQISQVNTRARLVAAGETGVISRSGCQDLVEAYDVIAMLRLENQARLVKTGLKPDNYLTPADLSDFERSHLRNAFVVVRTMQAAAGQGKGSLG